MARFNHITGERSHPLFRHCADVLDVQALAANVVGDVVDRGECDP
jgi:hypothetical protein